MVLEFYTRKRRIESYAWYCAAVDTKKSENLQLTKSPPKFSIYSHHAGESSLPVLAHAMISRLPNQRQHKPDFLVSWPLVTSLQSPKRVMPSHGDTDCGSDGDVEAQRRGEGEGEGGYLSGAESDSGLVDTRQSMNLVVRNLQVGGRTGAPCFV